MNLSAIFAVLSSNGSDIEDVVARLGGVSGTIKLIPDLLRIYKTISAHSGDPVAAVAAAQSVLEYSQQTADKVRTFQKANGLTADGIVGDQTWGAVEKLLQK